MDTYKEKERYKENKKNMDSRNKNLDCKFNWKKELIRRKGFDVNVTDWQSFIRFGLYCPNDMDIMLAKWVATYIFR